MKYLDTNVIIYAIENHPEYGAACKKILQNIQSKNLSVASSMLVLIEIISVLNKINKILKKEGKELLNIKDNIDAILALPIVWFDINFFIIKRAAEYSYNMAGADYIHLASMESNSIIEIISVDEEFDKISSIKRINPKNH